MKKKIFQAVKNEALNISPPISITVLSSVLYLDMLYASHHGPLNLNMMLNKCSQFCLYCD